MKGNDLIYRSIHIITEYYKNNLQPFFESVSDDILWIGPAERQQIRGKENLLRAWAAESHSLTFSMGDIKAESVSPHSHVREVLLHYKVSTHFPNGNVIAHDQRLHFTWRVRTVKKDSGREFLPEIVMIHISNAWKYDSRDTIYPVHYETVYPAQVPSKPEIFLTVKAVDNAVHRLAASRILYVDTVKRTGRLTVHTENGDVVICDTLPSLAERYPDLFLRAHAKYLVNPDHVREIRRFSMTLSDGTELPIPEKKYTEVKKALMWDTF